MVKIWLIVFVSVCLSLPVSAIEIDMDDNGAVDIARGGTNGKTVAEAQANLNVEDGATKGASASEAAAISANTLKISYTDAAAVSANTDKTGITAQQASDIATNNSKTSYTDSATVASAVQPGDAGEFSSLTIPQGASPSAATLWEGTDFGGLYKVHLNAGDLTADRTVTITDTGLEFDGVPIEGGGSTDLSSPGPIGEGTPSTGRFTSLTVPQGASPSVVTGWEGTDFGGVYKWNMFSGNLTEDHNIEVTDTGLEFDGAPIGGVGDALVVNPLSQFSATTSAQLLGVMSDETGTGSLVFDDTPALDSPAIYGSGTYDSTGEMASKRRSRAKSSNYSPTEVEMGGTDFFATASMILSLPAAIPGEYGCLFSQQGVAAVIQIQPFAGDYLTVDGVRGTAATAYASSGALGDAICFKAYGYADWMITYEKGTWSE